MKPIANVIFPGKGLNAFPITSGCLLALVLFNTVLEIIVNAIRQEKEIKKKTTQIWGRKK